MGKKKVELEDLLAAIRGLEEIVMAEDNNEDEEKVLGDEPKIRKGIGNVNKRMGKNSG